MNNSRTRAWLKDLFWNKSQCAASAAAFRKQRWWKEKLFLSLLVVTTIPSDVDRLAVPRTPGEQRPFISNKVRPPLQRGRRALHDTAICLGYHICSGKNFLRKQRCCHKKKCWDWLSLLVFSDTREVLRNGVLYFLYGSPMSWHCAYVRNNVKRCPVCVWAHVPVLLAMLGCQPGSRSGLALTLWVRTKGYQSVSIKLMFKLIFFRSAKDSTKESKKELSFLILSPCSNKGVINITVYYYFQFQVPCEARGAAVLVRILFSACQLSKWSPKTVWLTFIYKRKFFIPTHTCVFLKICLYSEKWL